MSDEKLTIKERLRKMSALAEPEPTLKKNWFKVEPTRHWLVTAVTRVTTPGDWADHDVYYVVKANTILEAEHIGLFLHVPEGFDDEGDL